MVKRVGGMRVAQNFSRFGGVAKAFDLPRSRTGEVASMEIQGVPMRQQFVMIAIALLLCSCESQNKSVSSNESAAPAPPTTFTGTLQNGVMGIGGEHTGWILVGDGETGGIEV